MNFPCTYTTLYSELIDGGEEDQPDELVSELNLTCFLKCQDTALLLAANFLSDTEERKNFKFQPIRIVIIYRF